MLHDDNGAITSHLHLSMGTGLHSWQSKRRITYACVMSWTWPVTHTIRGLHMEHGQQLYVLRHLMMATAPKSRPKVKNTTLIQHDRFACAGVTCG